jgi:hypothetical protein
LLSKLLFCYDNSGALKEKAKIGRKYVTDNFGLDYFNRAYNSLYDSSRALLNNK